MQSDMFLIPSTAETGVSDGFSIAGRLIAPAVDRKAPLLVHVTRLVGIVVVAILAVVGQRLCIGFDRRSRGREALQLQFVVDSLQLRERLGFKLLERTSASRPGAIRRLSSK